MNCWKTELTPKNVAKYKEFFRKTLRIQLLEIRSTSNWEKHGNHLVQTDRYFRYNKPDIIVINKLWQTAPSPQKKNMLHQFLISQCQVTEEYQKKKKKKKETGKELLEGWEVIKRDKRKMAPLRNSKYRGSRCMAQRMLGTYKNTEHNSMRKMEKIIVWVLTNIINNFQNPKKNSPMVLWGKY